MNQTQLKYARERANKIFKEKEVALTNKYTTPAKTLTTDQKLEALKAGDFKIVKSTKGSYNRMWWNDVDFGETFAVIDVEKRDPELAELRKKFEALTDELVLGDNETALQLLKDFELG